MFDGTCSFYMFHALPSWFWTGDCTEDHIFTEEELAATPVTFSTPPTPEGPARTEPKLEDAPDAARAGPKLEEPARTKQKQDEEGNDDDIYGMMSSRYRSDAIDTDDADDEGACHYDEGADHEGADDDEGADDEDDCLKQPLYVDGMSETQKRRARKKRQHLEGRQGPIDQSPIESMTLNQQAKRRKENRDARQGWKEV